MKVSTTLKPLVFAIAAAMAIAAQASEQSSRHRNHDPLLDRSAGDASAYAGRDQYIGNSQVTNVGTENSATIEDSLESSGNIGANVAAGDMNQQANNVAVATADEQFVFGSADADSTIEQNSDGWAHNTGGSNTSSLTGSGNGASGNIGVNAASGNFNQQQNALAIATARGRDATANASGEQNLSGGVENKAGSLTVTTTVDVTKDWGSNYSSEASHDSSRSWEASAHVEKSSSSHADGSVTSHYDSASTANSSSSSNLDVSLAVDKSSSSSSEWDKTVDVDATASASIDGHVVVSPDRIHAHGDAAVDIDATASVTENRSQESAADLTVVKNVTKDSTYSADESREVNKSFEADFNKSHEATFDANAQVSSSKEENHSFTEEGDSTLAATVTFTKSYEIANGVTNDAMLSGSLNGASGNLGVNIASGSGNQQLNTLAVAVGCNSCNNGE